MGIGLLNYHQVMEEQIVEKIIYIEAVLILLLLCYQFDVILKVVVYLGSIYVYYRIIIIVMFQIWSAYFVAFMFYVHFQIL